MEKVACYIRVSTQEQKLHGISLDAQRDKLTDYADKHDLKIVEWYEDEGISGRKLIRNRPALQRMLNDAREGKFDRIIFIKLDRFFRSVAEYHECMKIIEPIVWTATEEKYDLTTANGRAFVNMKLTIAELEADQTGERIKLVNEYKVKSGTVLFGTPSLPFGYRVGVVDGAKRVVKDEGAAAILTEAINYYIKSHNLRATLAHVKSMYDTDLTYKRLRGTLTNTLLYGTYRDNNNYVIEPYVDKTTYDTIQDIISRNVKRNPTNKTYLFTGLIICPCCGRKLSSSCINETYKRKSAPDVILHSQSYGYQCNKHFVDYNCSFNRYVSEKLLEKHLLQILDTYVNSYITNVKVADAELLQARKDNSKELAQLNKQMEKLKIMFRRDDITEKEYSKEMDAIKLRIKSLTTPVSDLSSRDLSVYESLLASDWKNIYNALTRENKAIFWRKYIKEIHIDTDKRITDVLFF